MDSQVYCRQCGKQINQNTRFCRHCGMENLAFAEKKGFVEKAKEKYRKTLEKTKLVIGNKIDNLLVDLENREKFTVGHRTLSTNSRNNIARYLTNIRSRTESGEVTEEEQKELEQYVEEFEDRLAGEKCLVCLKSLTSDPNVGIVACPHCERKGHEHHMREWLKMKPICPLCREELSEDQLVRVKIAH